ncbi:hypothetical protein Bca52824_035708 [Brassica carinata]|uniref:Secreted protein n=1 Tax=Brassica carinata TaxID=52824 RepID=A0A8X7V307_BRACI|nr:hypothetical protein Bca52824_035708 [Brassica carinata]
MWVVGAVCIFAGASAVDLLGSDHESDGAWSSDETFYPAVLHYHASLVAQVRFVSLGWVFMSGFLDPSRASLLLGDPVAGSQSWVRVRCFLFRCCRPSLEVPVAAPD